MSSDNWPGQHKCAAEGCNLQVQKAQLMCAFHYSQVPQDLKLQLMSAFREWERGADDFDECRKAVAELRRVQALCVEAVECSPSLGQRNPVPEITRPVRAHEFQAGDGKYCYAIYDASRRKVCEVYVATLAAEIVRLISEGGGK